MGGGGGGVCGGVLGRRAHVGVAVVMGSGFLLAYVTHSYKQPKAPRTVCRCSSDCLTTAIIA